MGNIHGNCINVDTLVRYGSTYRSEAIPYFLNSTDSWLMTVSQKTGPDGCLYILDWYDQYHCYQDANRDPAGIDRLKGRLYRVRYMQTPRRFGFDLARSGDDELIDFLRDTNVYVRDIAQRLLTERASPAIRGKLESLVLDERLPPHGADARPVGLDRERVRSEPAFHAKLLTRPDPGFRAWGVRAAGNMGRLEPAILEKVLSRAGDPSPDVKLQVAIAARKLQGVDPLQVLIAVQAASARDALLPQVVWQNLHPLLEGRQVEFAMWARRVGAGRLDPLVPHLVQRLLAGPKPDAEFIVSLLKSCSEIDPLREAFDLLAERFRERSLPAHMEAAIRHELIPYLRSAWQRQHPSHDDYSIMLAYCGEQDSMKEVWTIARTTWKDKDVEDRVHWEEMRIRAVNAILYRRIQGSIRSLVASILVEDDAMSSVDFRGDVLDSLDSLDDPEVPPVVLKAYAQLPGSMKPRAIELLTRRPAWTRAMLAAIAEKQVSATMLNVTQLRKLQQSKDPEIAGRIKAVWGTIREGRNPRRERIVDQVRRSIRNTPGDPSAGTAVFNKLCAQCHKIYGAGQEVGPDLTSNGRNDFNQLVSNVFDPSLVIGPGYQATTLATTDGRVLTGLLAEDGKDRVVLKLQGGKLEIIPRDQVEQVKTAEVSLMPEEIEKQLLPQEIADLFAFLCLDKPPTDPTAKPLPGGSDQEATEMKSSGFLLVRAIATFDWQPERMNEAAEPDCFARGEQSPGEGVGHPAGRDVPPVPAEGEDQEESSADDGRPLPWRDPECAARCLADDHHRPGRDHRRGDDRRSEHGRGPRDRDQEQDVPGPDRRRPAEQELQGEVVAQVPDAEGDQECRESLNERPARRQADAREHHERRRLAQDLDLHQPGRDRIGPLETVYRDQGEDLIGRAAIGPTGDRGQDRAEVDHNDRLDEPEADAEQHDPGQQPARRERRRGVAGNIALKMDHS